MTQEEILAMKPGEELDVKVAEDILGHVVSKDECFGYTEKLIEEDGGYVWSLLQHYSRDISAAELVVEKMIALGCDDAIYWADFGDGLYTEPEAICKAALLAILENTQSREVSDKLLQQALGDGEAPGR